MWFRSKKRKINGASKTTDLSLCFRSAVKSLKDFYLMNCTSFNENDLLSSNQSGFGPGDSCINQILSITHEIYQSFDNDLEVREVFLDISKAFQKVWHEGLILKLSRHCISGNLLNFLKDFLK